MLPRRFSATPRCPTRSRSTPLPVPKQRRATVEKLSALMANEGKLDQSRERLPLASQQIQCRFN